MSRWRRRLAFVAIATAGAIVLTLAAGELALRLYIFSRGWTPNCYAASLSMFRPHPQLGYDLQPNFVLRSGTFHIETNSLGLRGEEVRPSEPGVTRIAVVGGSSAFGYFVSDEQEAASILERRLQNKGLSVEVLNAGVPGYNLYQTIPRFDTLVAPLKPKIVVLYLGWNDLTYVVSPQPDAATHRIRPIAPAWERVLGRSVLYGFVAYRLLGHQPIFAPAALDQLQPTPAGEQAFLRNLQSLVDRIRKVNAIPVICSQASAAHPRVEDDLRKQLTKRGDAEAIVALGTWLDQTLENFAKQQNLTFIDAYDTIPPTKAMLADYIHLTAEGELKLGEFWADNLIPLLDQEKGKKP